MYLNFLKRLDDKTIHIINRLVALPKCSDVKKRLFYLLTRMGVLGISIFSEIADFEYINLILVTETLTIVNINQKTL